MRVFTFLVTRLLVVDFSVSIHGSRFMISSVPIMYNFQFALNANCTVRKIFVFFSLRIPTSELIQHLLLIFLYAFFFMHQLYTSVSENTRAQVFCLFPANCHAVMQNIIRFLAL